MVWARRLAAVAAVVSLGASFVAHAVGTAAGTNIQNTAQVSYTVGGTPATVASNTTSVTVLEILDVVVTIANPTVTVSPSATAEELVFTVTNTGNGTETFNLSALSAGVTGDDFDPVLTTPSAIYFDTDNSGDFSPSDVAYSPGTNDPVLAADASVRVLVVNSIPASVVNGNRGRSELTAEAATGTDSPGVTITVGGVDHVVGTTGADATLFGEYLVAEVQLTAVKSQTISDQFAGSRPLPGARINYQIVITPAGTGTAAATVFSDLIPANTTYVAGSLELNNAALSDGADADAGEFVSTPAQVRITLGDLTAASGAQTIEFAVTIN
jgi:uncharacterized repeat protein (TIGR01451 family)